MTEVCAACGDIQLYYVLSCGDPAVGDSAILMFAGDEIQSLDRENALFQDKGFKLRDDLEKPLEDLIAENNAKAELEKKQKEEARLKRRQTRDERQRRAREEAEELRRKQAQKDERDKNNNDAQERGEASAEAEL